MKETEKIVLRKSNYDNLIRGIEDWEIDKEDKKSINSFFEEYRLGKITGNIPKDLGSIEPFIYNFKVIFYSLKQPSKEWTEKDIDRFASDLLQDRVKTLKGTNFALRTKVKVRRLLKQFIEWKYPERIGMLKALRADVKIPDKTAEALTEAEMDKLYQNCRSSKERYLIAGLFSTGARASEFYNIRFSDITMPKGDEVFVKVRLRDVYSKTKGRVISLYYKYAFEAVRDYLEERKSEVKDFEEPVWNELVTTTNKKLIAMGKRVLNKHLHFHLFRSSSATHLANKLNRHELCYYFGWRFSSNMPDVYIQRAGLNLGEVDAKIQNTQLGELKQKLDKQDYDHNLTIEKMKKQIEELAVRYKILSEETGCSIS